MQLEDIHGPISLPEPNDWEIRKRQVEADPTGRGAHDLGAKLDAGKVRADLLLDFRHALVDVSKVATYGAGKYAPHSWLHVPDGIDRYTAALLRHLLEEGDDPETGLPHLAHALWNLMAVVELTRRKA